jgi:translation initiation factor IF-1
VKFAVFPALINPVRTSQETHYVSDTEPNQLILFGETVAVYCENHMEHINTLCGTSVRTSQETHYDSSTEPNRLILFGETVAVYCENHTEHINTLCGQFSSYLTGNTLRLLYRAQPVNAV